MNYPISADAQVASRTNDAAPSRVLRARGDVIQSVQDAFEAQVDLALDEFYRRFARF
jgi:hypothetical protein